MRDCMNKSLRGRLATLIVVVLLFGLLATTAFAAYGDTQFSIHFDFVNDVSDREASAMKADSSGDHTKLVADYVTGGLTASVHVVDHGGNALSGSGTISSSKKTAYLTYTNYGVSFGGWCHLYGTATQGYGYITGMWYFE